jgi:hypothetical protein
MKQVKATFGLVLRGPFDQAQYEGILQHIERNTDQEIVYQKVTPGYLKIVEEHPEAVQ